MKKVYDLSQLQWTVGGTTPYFWELETMSGEKEARVLNYDTAPVPARVPGSVQQSLLDAGIIEDWLVGMKSKNSEWVENRHWIYETKLPDAYLEKGRTVTLHCEGLDYKGWIFVNWQRVGEFCGTHTAYDFDLTPYLDRGENTLRIIFDLPPRWLGQFGYSSRRKEWKVRYNYTWDWVVRILQVGIWAPISLEVSDGKQIDWFSCAGDYDLETGRGKLLLKGNATGGELQVALTRDGATVAECRLPAGKLETWWEGLAVEPWWPNLMGEQPLYEVSVKLLAEDGVQDEVKRTVGFKHVEWIPCEGAAPQADPWQCVVNGRPVFLQGVNFQPIRANFADLCEEDYRKRIELYRDLGANMFRINACGYLEHTWLYDWCDRCGIMVWQEFPLTSSGVDNWPPEDAASIAAMAEIARGFVRRRQHHASTVMWSGGNELQGDLAGNKHGGGKPCDLSHPMLSALKAVAEYEDPVHRYVATSPLGPRSFAEEAEMGQGLHWDVHGPYSPFPSEEAARSYWEKDDALFRSEMCHPGANPAHLTRKYAGEWPLFPPTRDNPYWARPTNMWIDWEVLVQKHGREPKDLEEYVAWSQQNQAEALALGMKACKDRFPRCGGVLLWGSHDTFPVPANTTIIDFDGEPKPAAFALQRIWRGEA